MTLSLDGRWRLHTGKEKESDGKQMGEDNFRKRIDQILDETSAEDLKAIYYFLLGGVGIVLEAEGGQREQYHR